MSRRFTKKELNAIWEALQFRLAGPIEDYDDDPDAPNKEDYESALAKLQERDF